MHFGLRCRRFVGAAMLAACAIGIASCQWSKQLQVSLTGEETCDDFCGSDGKLSHEKSMMALAHDLDHLERQIDWYGSVVPKVPDVWGQARLTQHRDEFEKQMADDLTKFTLQLNGSVSRSDQAFLAQALALGAAVQQAPTGPIVQAVPLAPQSSTVTTTVNEKTPTGGTAQTQTQDSYGRATTLPPPTPADSAKLVSDPATGNIISRTEAKVDRTTISLQTSGIGLEPTIILEQKARYLNYLNQIRRTNEGDDTADSPGYSLNLIRIPVSLLPGKKTQEGYGAEVTFTLTPVLGDELLPTTFRNLLVNDLVDQIGLPLAKFLEEERLYKSEGERVLTETNRTKIEEILQDDLKPTHTRSSDGKTPAEQRKNQITQQFKSRLKLPSLPFANGLGARQPLATSQLLDVYGVVNSFVIADAVNNALSEDIDNLKYAHVPDVQMLLREELSAAYRFLSQRENLCLWNHHCTANLVTAVRSRQVHQLENLQTNFHQEALAISGLKFPDRTIALAWAMIVDAALLTDRLIKDMRDVASAKGALLPSFEWSDFYSPCPSVESRQAFNEYVKVRWPIRVFALDPATQDQNISDSLSTRREMQFALSLAFVTGRISANSLTRYTRRLEAEYQTVALNRTQIGFSHGENTFGWRFYPRYQTPDTDSNFTVIMRDQFIGGPSKNALLRQRRLEAGPRECVAIVVMPSFVPYLTCDSVSNWFALANPKHKEFDLKDTLRVSRSVKTLQVNGPCVQDAECYRSTELQSMMRRVEQLDSRLPTQTQSVQVPILNTLGGFKMFNNGVTDLGPELYGFYGAPGIDPNKTTTLFLVGDHFSVRNNKIIVGNYEVARDKVILLSRQVAQVTIPNGAVSIPYSYKGNPTQYVDVHLATPYGVTRDIYIPIVGSNAAVAGFTLKKNSLLVTYDARPDGKGKFSVTNGKADDASAVVIIPNDAVSALAPAIKVRFKFIIGGMDGQVLPVGEPFVVRQVNEEYKLSKDDLKRIAADLVSRLNAAGPFAIGADPFLAGIRTTEVTISPLYPDCSPTAPKKDEKNPADPGCLPCRELMDFKAANQLEVKLKGALAFPPEGFSIKPDPVTVSYEWENDKVKFASTDREIIVVVSGDPAKFESKVEIEFVLHLGKEIKVRLDAELKDDQYKVAVRTLLDKLQESVDSDGLLKQKKTLSASPEIKILIYPKTLPNAGAEVPGGLKLDLKEKKASVPQKQKNGEKPEPQLKDLPTSPTADPRRDPFQRSGSGPDLFRAPSPN